MAHSPQRHDVIRDVQRIFELQRHHVALHDVFDLHESISSLRRLLTVSLQRSFRRRYDVFPMRTRASTTTTPRPGSITLTGFRSSSRISGTTSTSAETRWIS